jgi:hypothetical protein
VSDDTGNNETQSNCPMKIPCHCEERSDEAIQSLDGLGTLSLSKRLDRHGALRAPRDDNWVKGQAQEGAELAEWAGHGLSLVAPSRAPKNQSEEGWNEAWAWSVGGHELLHDHPGPVLSSKRPVAVTMQNPADG